MAKSYLGVGLFNILRVNNLESFDINIINYVGDSFDGTANMSGQCKDVQA